MYDELAKGQAEEIIRIALTNFYPLVSVVKRDLKLPGLIEHDINKLEIPSQADIITVDLRDKDTVDYLIAQITKDVEFEKNIWFNEAKRLNCMLKDLLTNKGA